MENGLYSKNCVTDFPSVTFPTQPTEITGTYTGDYRKELCHGVPLYNWMGRDYAPPILRNYGANNLQIYKMNDDIGPNCQTILEMVEEGNKASFTQYINRGTDFMVPKSKVQLVYYYLLINAGAKRNTRKIIARVNTAPLKWLIESFRRPKKFFGNNETPIGTLLWFMSSDVLMHWHGYDSHIYKLNLKHIDKLIGIMIDELDAMGYLDSTVLAFTADHGNYKAKKSGNIMDLLQRKGLRQFHRRKYIKGNMDLAEFGSVGVFNFNGKNTTGNKYGWTHPTIGEMEKYGPKSVNLFEELFKTEGTELMYHRKDGNTHEKGALILQRKDPKIGNIIKSVIEYRGSGKDMKTAFRNDQQEDVFGFGRDEKAVKLCDGKFHSIEDWLEATYHLDFAMHPDLLVRHFKNPRSCDIMVSTCGNVIYNIGHGKKKSDNLYSHDIGLRNSTIVPLIIGGSPEIPQKEVLFCKTTDIVPSLLKCIGKKPHESVVGRSLI